jgi:GAF domain-containing protein
LKTGEALRAAIQALALPHVGNEGWGVVTVSIGIATAGSAAQGYDVERLISTADSLLYEAKRTGRNRVLSNLNRPVDPLPPALPDEEDRLAAVDRFHASAMAERSDRLDQIAKQAADLLGAPIGLVSLVGRDRQFFVGRYGLEAEQTSRRDSFCAHAIAGTSPMVVENAATDPRFRDNPLVTDGINIRFYAGAPLISVPEGHHLGAVCVIDSKPRPTLSRQQRDQLAALAALAIQSVKEAAEVS